jgi:hypothetical protein
VVLAPPRGKRNRRTAWIVAAVSVLLLWMFIKWLSLDYPGAAPAVHWTAPTGTG